MSGLPGLNAGAVDACISRLSPVPGFRPVWAGRLFVVNVPNPPILTPSPFARTSPTASTTASTAFPAAETGSGLSGLPQERRCPGPATTISVRQSSRGANPHQRVSRTPEAAFARSPRRCRSRSSSETERNPSSRFRRTHARRSGRTKPARLNPRPPTGTCGPESVSTARGRPTLRIGTVRAQRRGRSMAVARAATALPIVWSGISGP